MNDNPWSNYPFISAAVLAASGVLFVFNGYYLLDGVPDSPERLLTLRLRLGAGFVLWVTGCGLVSRTRHDSWKKGLLWSLLLVPGPIALLFTTGGKTRQEIWEAANPGLARTRARGQYRDVKPLY